MNNVSIVNLAGRAFHVESAGADRLREWLTTAEQRLASDPSRDEIMRDFESALADRCELEFPGVRDVVTNEAAARFVAAMGDVEPINDSGERDSEPGTGTNADATSANSAKRFYRLKGEGVSKIEGVCAGMAAYFNVDVTMVRIAWAFLVIGTSGTAILLYVLAAIIAPVARTPEERALASGQGATDAKELMRRAREQRRPTLQRAGEVARSFAPLLGRVLRVAAWICIFIIVLCIIPVMLMTALWPEWTHAWADPGSSRWSFLVLELSAAWLVAAVPAAVLVTLRVVRRDMRGDRSMRNAGHWAAWSAVTVAALTLVMLLGATMTGDLRRDLRRDHFAVRHLGNSELCIAHNQMRAHELCPSADGTITLDG